MKKTLLKVGAGVCCDLIWRVCDFIEVTFPDKKEEKKEA